MLILKLRGIFLDQNNISSSIALEASPMKWGPIFANENLQPDNISAYVTTTLIGQ